MDQKSLILKMLCLFVGLFVSVNYLLKYEEIYWSFYFLLKSILLNAKSRMKRTKVVEEWIQSTRELLRNQIRSILSLDLILSKIEN